jgi:hypothetical protein
MSDRLCTWALWLYYVGLAALTWATGLMLFVAGWSVRNGAPGDGAFLAFVAVFVTWEPWRALFGLRRDLFRAPS